eukprot:GHVU01079914.1.p1 GENE.GHVU01079914.1~~GHVU01079914.1.p1  ORF type:complete len:237 (-),score=21.01 GHVU01079914.1:576-1286(-)
MERARDGLHPLASRSASRHAPTHTRTTTYTRRDAPAAAATTTAKCGYTSGATGDVGNRQMRTIDEGRPAEGRMGGKEGEWERGGRWPHYGERSSRTGSLEGPPGMSPVSPRGSGPGFLGVNNRRGRPFSSSSSSSRLHHRVSVRGGPLRTLQRRLPRRLNRSMPSPSIRRSAAVVHKVAVVSVCACKCMWRNVCQCARIPNNCSTTSARPTKAVPVELRRAHRVKVWMNEAPSLNE